MLFRSLVQSLHKLPGGLSFPPFLLVVIRAGQTNFQRTNLTAVIKAVSCQYLAKRSVIHSFPVKFSQDMPWNTVVDINFGNLCSIIRKQNTEIVKDGTIDSKKIFMCINTFPIRTKYPPQKTVDIYVIIKIYKCQSLFFSLTAILHDCHFHLC